MGLNGILCSLLLLPVVAHSLCDIGRTVVLSLQSLPLPQSILLHAIPSPPVVLNVINAMETGHIMLDFFFFFPPQCLVVYT